LGQLLAGGLVVRGYSGVQLLAKEFEHQRLTESDEDEGGGWGSVWTALGTLVGAPMSVDARTVDLANARGRQVDLTIYVGGPPEAKEEDRLVFEGRYFYVTGVEDLGLLGQHTIYEVAEGSSDGGPH
jgi:hypothetical protein